MSSNRNIQVTIREYLLGQLAGDGLEQFEQQLFSDDDMFEEVLAAEDELIDESIEGRLNPNESELFAKFFLNSPEREQNVLFRQVLKNYAEKKNRKLQPAPKRWSFLPAAIQSVRAAVASAALAVVVALVALMLLIPLPPTSFATVNLTIGVSNRAGSTPAEKIKLPLNADALKLQLALPQSSNAANSYRVELRKISGETKTLEPLSKDEKSVVVVIPAAQLARDQYALNLYVTKPGEPEQRIPGSYYFTVE
jgi:hypothetical protein